MQKGYFFVYRSLFNINDGVFFYPKKARLKQNALSGLLKLCLVIYYQLNGKYQSPLCSLAWAVAAPL